MRCVQAFDLARGLCCFSPVFSPSVPDIDTHLPTSILIRSQTLISHRYCALMVLRSFNAYFFYSRSLLAIVRRSMVGR